MHIPYSWKNVFSHGQIGGNQRNQCKLDAGYAGKKLLSIATTSNDDGVVVARVNVVSRTALGGINGRAHSARRTA